MAEYRAPLKDMQFVLKHLAGLDKIAALPGYGEATADMVAAILEQAGKLASEVISPLNVIGDQQGSHMDDQGQVSIPDGFKEAYQQFAESGWGSLQFDEQYGGQSMPLLLSAPLLEMWQAANLAWGLCPLLTQGAIDALEANASDDLKQQYIPYLVSGQWTGTMNLTEPQAGSDLAAIRAKAEPEGDHYRIYGQKIFITWGDHEMAQNILHLVLARLPDGPAGVQGISMFLVPKFLLNDDGSLGQKNDCKAVSLERKMGIHASPTCLMSFGDKEGAIGYLVGDKHKGLACMFSMMNSARLAVGIQGVSISERAYQQAVDYARERVQSVAPGATKSAAIIRHPDVRRMLMTMRGLTEAVRALAYSGYTGLDYQKYYHHHGESNQQDLHSARVALLTPIIKGWCTEIAQEVTSLGLQVHGGTGFIEETGAAQHCRDARILTIYEGTTGIQAMDLVGRKTLADQGAAMNSMITQMLESIDAAMEQFPALGKMAADLLAAVEALKRSQCCLLKGANDDINLPGSMAFNYMMLAGTVCGGWQMLTAAQASVEVLSEDNPATDQRFYKAKITTAIFYMEHILPRYMNYAAGIVAGSDSIMALDEVDF